jgi:hypothetical protein
MTTEQGISIEKANLTELFYLRGQLERGELASVTEQTNALYRIDAIEQMLVREALLVAASNWEFDGEYDKAELAEELAKRG